MFLLKRKEIDSLPPHEYKYLVGTPLTFLGWFCERAYYFVRNRASSAENSKARKLLTFRVFFCADFLDRPIHRFDTALENAGL